ncbi:MAG: DUF533 domain-containing protein [Gemmobacter sp.]
MSFVRTLATLAAGFAAAKGVEMYKQGGGMAGIQEQMRKNPQLAGMADQMEAMMTRLGIPGVSRQPAEAVTSAAAGLGGLLGALGGMAAQGVAAGASMMDQLTGTSAATEATEANARLMIRAMIQAAKADGEIDAEERRIIMTYLEGATAEERDFVEQELKKPVDPLGLARDAGAEAAAQVYTAAAMAIRVDTDAEAQYLRTLAAALGLDAATVKSIHVSLHKPAPK